MKVFKSAGSTVALAVLLVASARPALAYSPAVEVAPSMVAAGQTANVYGTGYCPQGCSKVTIAVEGKQVANGVAVGGDGKFHATFVVTQFPGSYHVTATQQAADGTTLQATTGMTVQLSDNRRASPTPPAGNPPPAPPATSPPATSPPAGQAVAPSPSATDSGGPTAPLESSPITQRPPVQAAADVSSGLWPLAALGLLVVLAVLGVVLWRRRTAAASDG